MHYFEAHIWVMLRACRRLLCLVSSKAPVEPPTAMSVSAVEDYFAPPETVRGCEVLDRASFQREFQLSAIRLPRANVCSAFMKRLSHACLRFRAIKSVLKEDGKDGTVSG